MSTQNTDEASPRVRDAGRKRVLLIGASGFVGSSILRALQTRTDTRVSILARGRSEPFGACGPTVLTGDLTDPASLADATDGIDIVINSASYVGSDPEQARRVNLNGTLAVLRSCEGSTVSRIIQLSTTAVYGSGPHQGVRPWEARYQPESVASQSRCMADQAMLAAGGVVIRPNLVYGPRDRWFIPGVVRMFRALGATIDDGRALISLVDVEDLGILVAAAATAPTQVSGAFHAAHPVPIRLEKLLAIISECLTELRLKRSTSLSDAVRRLEPAGFSPHQVNMLGSDHHYLSDELWHIAEYSPRTFRMSPEAVSWYQRQLNGVAGRV